MRRVREDFPAGEIIDPDEPGWGNTNSGDEADFLVEDEDWVQGEKDLETTKNDSPKKRYCIPERVQIL